MSLLPYMHPPCIGNLIKVSIMTTFVLKRGCFLIDHLTMNASSLYW